ncbi:MAG: hypothetical protein NT082_03300 [Chloroflexi bacterium]|nr:hypothetical protein [Chloroflexota bacterium]
MSKKSRRARAKIRGTEPVVQRTIVKQGQVKSGVSRPNLSAQSAIASANVIKANQYDYVVSDLIRVGIIGGALILILIILTFVLR